MTCLRANRISTADLGNKPRSPESHQCFDHKIIPPLLDQKALKAAEAGKQKQRRSILLLILSLKRPLGSNSTLWRHDFTGIQGMVGWEAWWWREEKGQAEPAVQASIVVLWLYPDSSYNSSFHSLHFGVCSFFVTSWRRLFLCCTLAWQHTVTAVLPCVWNLETVFVVGMHFLWTSGRNI